MSYTPAVIIQGGTQLPDTVAAQYTAPANTHAVLKRTVFTNADAVNHAITVYKVASGGAPGPTNIVIAAMALSAGQAYVAAELANLTFNPGDTLQCFADTAAKVNVVSSGFIF